MKDTIKEAVLALAETNPELAAELLASTETTAGNYDIDYEEFIGRVLAAGMKLRWAGEHGQRDSSVKTTDEVIKAMSVSLEQLAVAVAELGQSKDSMALTKIARNLRRAKLNKRVPEHLRGL